MRLVLVLSALSVCSGLRIMDRPGETMERQFETDSGSVTLIVGNKKSRAIKFNDPGELGVPAPIEIKSPVMGVVTIGSDSGRRGRKIQLMTLDTEGVPVIHGVREPDDPSDTRVFRNARVINNVLITSDDDIKNMVQSTNEDSQLQSRQGRILTGPVISKEEQKESAPIRTRPVYPTNYYRPDFNSDRIGIIEPPLNHQVSSPYSASGSNVQQNPNSKSVVYGFGNAAPPGRKVALNRNFAPGRNVAPQPVPAVVRRESTSSSFKFPTDQWETGFNPTNSLFGPPKSFTKFQHPVPLPLSTFVGSSSSFSAKPVNNNIAPSNVRVQQPHVTSPWANYQQQRPFVNVAQQFETQQFNSPAQFQQQNRFIQKNQFGSQGSHFKVHTNNIRPVHTNNIRPVHTNNIRPVHKNKIKQIHNGHSVPTPHEAFGDASSSIHPGIIPVSSDNFIIQETTFQSHPGGPAFSIPVPRPASQIQNDNRAVQSQFFGHNPHNQFNPYYLEEVDSRPFIERMMDPIRRAGERFREIASPVLDPMVVATHRFGNRFGNRFRIPERMDSLANGALDADPLSLVAGAAAMASLGALGAYAATKIPLTKFFSAKTGERSTKVTVPDILLQIVNDLEEEEPSFMKKFSTTSNTSWLESSCAKKVFCSLVSSSLAEEEEKLKEEAKLMAEELGEEIANTRSRQGREFLATDILLLEKQMELLIDSSSPTAERRLTLSKSADEVLESVRQGHCEPFVCNETK